MEGVSALKAKKILIVGCCGAGKSYFARQLSQVINVPIYYLDCIFWQENWTNLPRDIFLQKQNEIMANDEWIIDGNYGGTFEERFIKADCVFYFDIDVQVCIASEEARRGQKRPDLPDFLVEEYDPVFIDFIKNFKATEGKKLENLFDKYPDKKVIVFKTREEKEYYLKH